MIVVQPTGVVGIAKAETIAETTARSGQPPRRVLVVSNMYPSRNNPIGGIFVHEQVKALRRAGVDARVVTGRPLWLSGRHPVAALRRTRAEVVARRQSPQFLEYDGVPVLEFNYFAGAYARPWLYPWIYAGALKDILAGIGDRFPYDIVHTHTAFLDGRAGAAAAAMRGVPMLLTEHTGPFSLVTQSRLFRMHTMAGMSAADRVLAVSDALRTQILAQLNGLADSKVSVLPNGVDTTFFDPQHASAVDKVGCIADIDVIDKAKADLVMIKFILGLREAARDVGSQPLSGDRLAGMIDEALLTGVHSGRYTDVVETYGLKSPHPWNDPADAPPGAINAIWIGHHVDVKRVDRLLDAFAIATRRRPELYLTLVGGGPLLASLDVRARSLGIAEKVFFLPSSSRAVVRERLMRSDMLVISSDTETFGVVGIEAMAMGLPVLATRCGGPQDYVTDATGVLVDRTAEDLAIGFASILDRLAEFDRSAIRQHAIDRFDFGVVAAALCKIYHTMIDERNRRVAAG